MSAHARQPESSSTRPTRITVERQPPTRHRSTSAEPADIPPPAVLPPVPPLRTHIDPNPNERTPTRPPRSRPPMSEPYEFQPQPRSTRPADWERRAAPEPVPATAQSISPGDDTRFRHPTSFMPDPPLNEDSDRRSVHNATAQPGVWIRSDPSHVHPIQVSQPYVPSPSEQWPRPSPALQSVPPPTLVRLGPIRSPSPIVIAPPGPVFDDNSPPSVYHRPLSPHVYDIPPPMTPPSPTYPVIQIDVAAAGDNGPAIPQFVNPYEPDHVRSHRSASERPKTFDDIGLVDEEDADDLAWRQLVEPGIPPLPPPLVVYLPPGLPRRRTCCDLLKSLIFFIEDSTLSRIFYSAFLLGLPSLYFSRVAKIFVGANRSLKKLRKFAMKTLSKERIEELLTERDRKGVKLELPPTYVALEREWEGFVDSLVSEWVTLNTVSALILPAILTILQIEDAAKDYITRYTAMFSLICALVSLVFGCSYIVRFGQMKRPHKAAEWALEAQQKTTGVWWNVWVMLALPAIWLAWSLVMFTVCIMAYLWRSDIVEEGGEPVVRLPTSTQLLAFRVILSTFVGLGVVFALAAGWTLRRYGSSMDRDWERRINEWFRGAPRTRPGATQMNPLSLPHRRRQISRWNGRAPHLPPQPDDGSLDSDEKARHLSVREGNYRGDGYTFFGDTRRTASQRGSEAIPSVDDKGPYEDGLRRVTLGDSDGDPPVRSPTPVRHSIDGKKLKKQRRPDNSV